MYPKNNNLIHLYRERRKIKNNTRPFALKKYHWMYIRTFILKNLSSLFFLLTLIVLQVFIEIIALLFINSSLQERIYGALHNHSLSFLITTTLLGAFSYLFITFFSLAYERKMVLGLINDLRQKWFSDFLHQHQKTVTNEKKASLIAKLSYHLPLLSLGVDHSLFGMVRWFLSAIILLVLGLIAGIKILEGILLALIVSLVIVSLAYLIAHFYISQEVTSYSQVIKHIVLTFSEFSSTKNLHLEQQAIKDLETRVALDTHFRIRRDVWLRYFNRLLFAFIFITGFFLYVIAFSHPNIISFFYNPSSTILSAIISLYLIRLWYEAGSAGLYLPPLKLGIFLSIPEYPHTSFSKKEKIDWKEITFRSTKTKLFLEGEYFHHVSMTFKRGYRYLFTAPSQIGKTSWARILGGNPEFNENGWLVKVDHVRHGMSQWMSGVIDTYFFTPRFSSEKTINELIQEKEFSKVYSLYEKYPVFNKALSKKRFTGDSIKICEDSAPSLFAIQALYCICNNISFVVIDNYWIDLQYPEIIEMLRVLEKELPLSTLIVCARHQNDMIAYNKIYEIKKNTFEIL